MVETYEEQFNSHQLLSRKDPEHRVDIAELMTLLKRMVKKEIAQEKKERKRMAPTRVHKTTTKQTAKKAAEPKKRKENKSGKSNKATKKKKKTKTVSVGVDKDATTGDDDEGVEGQTNLSVVMMKMKYQKKS